MVKIYDFKFLSLFIFSPCTSYRQQPQARNSSRQEILHLNRLPTHPKYIPQINLLNLSVSLLYQFPLSFALLTAVFFLFVLLKFSLKICITLRNCVPKSFPFHFQFAPPPPPSLSPGVSSVEREESGAGHAAAVREGGRRGGGGGGGERRRG